MTGGSINSIMATAKRILRNHGIAFERQMVTAHLSGPTGPNSLSVRTGNLRRSIKTSTGVMGTTAALEGYVRNTAPYARIHEYGGTIKPVKAKMLAIPLDRRMKAMLGPRQYPGKLVLIKTKRGTLLLMEATGKRGNMKAVYVLKPSVYIPPRLNFRTEFATTVQQALAELRSAFGRIPLKGKIPRGGPKV